MRIEVNVVEATYRNFEFIRVESDGDAIGRIALSGNGGVGHNVRLLIAKPALANFPTPTSFPPDDDAVNLLAYVAGASLAGVSADANSTNVILVGLINGDITGPVTVGEVYTLRLRTGRITAPVTATKAESNYLGDRTDDAKPFAWTAGADTILGRVAKNRAVISKSGH